MLPSFWLSIARRTFPTASLPKSVPPLRENLFHRLRHSPIQAGITRASAACATLTKQLLFDLWKENQINILIDGLDDETVAPSVQRREQILGRIQELNLLKLRVLDAALIGPVEKKQEGSWRVPQWNDDHLVLDENETESVIEEHTLNVLCRYNLEGNIDSVSLCCPFYHTTFPLASGEIPLSDQNFSKTGPGFQVGTIMLYNKKTKKLEKRNFRMKPTAYAGPRDTYDKSSRVNKFMGLPIPNYDPNSYLRTKSTIEQRVAAISHWHKQKVTQV